MKARTIADLIREYASTIYVDVYSTDHHTVEFDTRLKDHLEGLADYIEEESE